MTRVVRKRSNVSTRYSVLNIDLDSLAIPEIYNRLVGRLQIDLKHAGEGKLRELLSETPEDFRLAGYLYALATEDYERVTAHYEELMGEWIVGAREAIAGLKQSKRWEGGVYTADVDRWVAANVPEHRRAAEVLRKSKRIRDAARRLFEAYESRLSSLQSYSRLVQKRPSVLDSQLLKEKGNE